MTAPSVVSRWHLHEHSVTPIATRTPTEKQGYPYVEKGVDVNREEH